MARVLIVQNAHPHEAVAIRLSRIAGKLLASGGHEVIFEKIPFGKTPLGIIYSMGKNNRKTITPEEYRILFERNAHQRRVRELKRKHNASIALDFHSDFRVDGWTRIYHRDYWTVEVGAWNRSSPKRLQHRVDKGQANLSKWVENTFQKQLEELRRHRSELHDYKISTYLNVLSSWERTYKNRAEPLRIATQIAEWVKKLDKRRVARAGAVKKSPKPRRLRR